MNLEQINDAIRTKGEKVTDLSARLALAATMPTPDLKQVSALQEELNRENSALQALKLSASSMTGEQSGKLNQQPAARAPQAERSLREMLKSNEYARAYALAIRRGLTPDSGRGVEELHPLYDALTIGGGTTPGEDGGFLVPEDIDHSIHELMRALNPLRPYFASERVNTNSGWRVSDTAPTTGFTAVNEMAAVPRDDQPEFGRVAYTLTKYGLILPISNELASDEVGNLFAYISRWAAKKEVITENTLLLAALATLSDAFAVTAGSEWKGIKKVRNVSLDPAIAQNAMYLTNQDGWNVMDCLEDDTGRPLLQWAPQDRTRLLFAGRPVAVVSNAVLASTTTGEGQSAVTKAPLYVGSGEQFATLFERQAMEVLSTRIGGNAFNYDMTEIRFIKRMGVSKFYANAMKKLSLTV